MGRGGATPVLLTKHCLLFFTKPTERDNLLVYLTRSFNEENCCVQRRVNMIGQVLLSKYCLLLYFI